MESCLPLLPTNPPDSRSLILHGGQSQPAEGKPLPLTRCHTLRLWSIHSDHIDGGWDESGPASVDSHESLFCRISAVFLTQIKIRPPANAHHSGFQTLQTIWRSVSPLTNLYLAVQSCEIRIFKCFNGHLGDFGEEEEVLRVITSGGVLVFLRQIHLPDWQLGENFERCFYVFFFFGLAVFPLTKINLVRRHFSELYFNNLPQQVDYASSNICFCWFVCCQDYSKTSSWISTEQDEGQRGVRKKKKNLKIGTCAVLTVSRHQCTDPD